MFNLPKVPNKELTILNLLINSSKELYGLEMIEKSDNELKKGSIYVLLSRLEDKGFIESRKESVQKGERGLPRRMYKITGEGQRAYRAIETMSNSYSKGAFA